MQAAESAENMRADAERRRAEVEEEAERLNAERIRLTDEQALAASVVSVSDDAALDARPVDESDETGEDVVEDMFGSDRDNVDDPKVPERHEQSRYERNSAKLPRIGDDAANVVRSLESFRKSLRGS